jgi:hypothetical protein
MKRPALILLPLLIGACAPHEILKLKNPPSGPFQTGLNIHMDGFSSDAQAAGLGADWVRIDVNWDGVEPSRGAWNFAATDQSVEGACEAGLKIYATLAYSPAWASASGKNTAVPDSAAWQDFVAAVARRYQGEISAYGIWNEPNLEEFWDGSAEDYVQVLLKPAAAAIRREDPEALVAGPELAHLYSARLGIQDFFDTLKRLGGDQCLDMVSHHLYGSDDFRQKVEGFRLLNVLYKPGLREMLVRAGLGGKEVWITEIGVDARPGGDQGQARRLVDQLKFLRDQGWVNKAFVYELASHTAQGPQWGLLRPDGTPRPAWGALQKFNASLPRAETLPPDHP